jgi:hypothetical protein
MTQILSLVSLEELASLARGLSAFIAAANSQGGQTEDEHD